jgi:hypothetical protein
MKHASCLYIGLLAICISGCQVHQRKSQKSWEEHGFARSDEYSVSVNELSEIIPPLCGELGIEIKKNVKGRTRIDITGTSMSGRQVLIEANEVVKGKSLVLVTAKADNEVTAKGLCDTVYYQLRDAIHNKKEHK